MLARDIIRIGARIGAACALFSILAWGQPALTTISDVLFKADATRFNGLAEEAVFSDGSWVWYETRLNKSAWVPPRELKE